MARMRRRDGRGARVGREPLRQAARAERGRGLCRRALLAVAGPGVCADVPRAPRVQGRVSPLRGTSTLPPEAAVNVADGLAADGSSRSACRSRWWKFTVGTIAETFMAGTEVCRVVGGRDVVG